MKETTITLEVYTEYGVNPEGFGGEVALTLAKAGLLREGERLALDGFVFEVVNSRSVTLIHP